MCFGHRHLWRLGCDVGLERLIMNTPAFPTETAFGYEFGMTLRDYFAAKAMQGLLASYGNNLEPSPKLCAEWSYAMSDAMLKARQA